MSIRLKVLLACFGFLAITASVGLFARHQDAALGTLTKEVYDNALIGVKYAQKVQIDFMRLKARRGHVTSRSAFADAQLRSLLDDLDIATERAMSDKGKAQAVAVRAELASLSDQVARGHLEIWDEIDGNLDRLVRQYTADGFTYRIRAGDMVNTTDQGVVGVIGAAILLALAIALLLNRAIVPPLQRATNVALAIAAGRLDNRIEPRGRDETARLLRSLATMQDSIRSARDDLETANLDLQGRVVELRAAQDELMRKERLSALGQLTATMAHEIRNPLSAIRNSFYSIKELVAGSGLKLERPIERVERSIARCDRIINDLLDFTRVRDLRCTVVAADKWIDEILHEQRLPDGVTLVRDLAAPGSDLSLDAERMRRVLNNLVENAAQAIIGAAAGLPERKITIGTRASLGAVEITIADTGPGIAAEILPKIFEPLFTTKSFGTGLGLPMVRQIVEQHGGTVDITSAPNQGTRVVLTIPRADSKEIAA